MSTAQPRRGDTRRRIQEIALELFLERGYEGTSLREIAERLDVTKAALYYHFKTKEDILVALVESYSAPLGEIIEWAGDRPRDERTRRELLARYSVVVQAAAPLFTFLYENQAALRELSIGQRLKDQMLALWGLFIDREGELAEQARSVSALITVHFGGVAMRELPGTAEAKRLALLEVATEMVCGGS
ncbi:TetR/AcrR family transcriptional regulator [Streptomyces sp. SL13]|jgi:AcrR family transcriptional regulator|uniref:TetR/AcrR family transcriptional regulator n=1 Tax=Streptantibioticus silvisoli TaxID=2705255 RepID=A0AA90H2C4_9ACTN|nr:TetR/AcrR family transcriptional regulator [Streptantibioticus silvisoli]MDI5966172.1 TetR/AcrR family transcriptional regulator [Streptantibioticus silvisoli]MDI5972783.1 TetR/AcrR family transcriptional regulator [Streptantibioticus silvisoli]